LKRKNVGRRVATDCGRKGLDQDRDKSKRLAMVVTTRLDNLYLWNWRCSTRTPVCSLMVLFFRFFYCISPYPCSALPPHSRYYTFSLWSISSPISPKCASRIRYRRPPLDFEQVNHGIQLDLHPRPMINANPQHIPTVAHVLGLDVEVSVNRFTTYFQVDWSQSFRLRYPDLLLQFLGKREVNLPLGPPKISPHPRFRRGSPISRLGP